MTGGKEGLLSPEQRGRSTEIREIRTTGLTGSCLLTPGEEESHPRGKGKKGAQEELRSAKYLLEGADLNQKQLTTWN